MQLLFTVTSIKQYHETSHTDLLFDKAAELKNLITQDKIRIFLFLSVYSIICFLCEGTSGSKG